VATQVVIDVETLGHMLRHEWPLHRQLHSYLGSTATGLITGALVFAATRVIARFVAWRNTESREPFRAELVSGTLGSSLIGGLIGGASHTLLDAIMHTDVQPYWPFSSSNGYLRAVNLATLHLGCVLAAGLGIVILWMSRPQSAADKD
jgi:hypothetical protein